MKKCYEIFEFSSKIPLIQQISPPLLGLVFLKSPLFVSRMAIFRPSPASRWANNSSHHPQQYGFLPSLFLVFTHLTPQISPKSLGQGIIRQLVFNYGLLFGLAPTKMLMLMFYIVFQVFISTLLTHISCSKVLISCPYHAKRCQYDAILLSWPNIMPNLCSLTRLPKDKASLPPPYT